MTKKRLYDVVYTTSGDVRILLDPDTKVLAPCNMSKYTSEMGDDFFSRLKRRIQVVLLTINI